MIDINIEITQEQYDIIQSLGHNHKIFIESAIHELILKRVEEFRLIEEFKQISSTIRKSHLNENIDPTSY